ncbi:hypothetical protein [Kitasatospora griseola]|uniref:hypothetical protein n=1 Tax=Kitasatospora griseola TaxID=2064 RepID=UPI00366A2C9D
MSTDQTREHDAETEAVLSLQETPAIDGDDVEAHGPMSATSVALCPTTPTNPTHTEA